MKLVSQALLDHGAWRQHSTPLYMGPGSSTQVGATAVSHTALCARCKVVGGASEAAAATGVRIVIPDRACTHPGSGISAQLQGTPRGSLELGSMAASAGLRGSGDGGVAGMPAYTMDYAGNYWAGEHHVHGWQSCGAMRASTRFAGHPLRFCWEIYPQVGLRKNLLCQYCGAAVGCVSQISKAHVLRRGFPRWLNKTTASAVFICEGLTRHGHACADAHAPHAAPRPTIGAPPTTLATSCCTATWPRRSPAASAPMR